MSRTTTAVSPPPPPVPIHYSTPTTTLNISIIQPRSSFESNTNIIDPPDSVKRPSYLGRLQQQQLKKKRNVLQQKSELLLEDYDSSTSSSDESDEDGYYSNRSSAQSYNRRSTTEEHKFWQVHSSTTIIAPPMMADADYSAAISMNYVNPRKKQALAARIPLAIQVHNVLSSTFDDVDEEIEREWENSRTQLRKSLIVLPTRSLSSPSY